MISIRLRDRIARKPNLYILRKLYKLTVIFVRGQIGKKTNKRRNDIMKEDKRLSEIMSMQFRDRIACPECKKEIVSPNGKPVHNCPHCGTSIFATMWMKDKDVKFIAKGLRKPWWRFW